MNNEQTKTPGQALYESGKGCLLIPWVNLSTEDKDSFEKWASAVISHVLQGAKYVLIPRFEARPDDEVFDGGVHRWFPHHLYTQTKDAKPDWPIRRPISLPSSVRPEGKPWGGLAEFFGGEFPRPSTAPPVSSGAAVADVRPRCESCHCYMTPAKALSPSVAAAIKGDTVTASQIDMEPLVDVWKCSECGHSFRCDAQPVWKLPPPPAGMKWHREDWTQDMLPEGWRPLLSHESQEPGDAFLERDGSWTLCTRHSASPAKVYGTHYRTNRPLPQSAEPVVEETVAQLSDLLVQLGSLTSERDQLRKELEVLRRKTDNRGVLSVTEDDETYREQCWKMMYSSMFHDLDEHRKKASALTTENAALKEEIAREKANFGHENMTAALHALEDAGMGAVGKPNTLRAMVEEAVAELTRLRSQLRWTPISERLPTEKDADQNDRVLWVNHNGWVYYTFWDWSASPREANKVVGWMTPIPLPDPSPPETKEQTMRREFEEWARSSDELRHVSYELTGLMGDYVSSRLQAAWLGYQAAKQSTGGQV